MKNFVIAKSEYPFIAALILYVLAGAVALSLYFSGGVKSLPASIVAQQGDELYDIRPELNETPEQVAQEAAEETHYYAFTTVTKINNLHVRTGPSLDAEIIGKLPKGTTGFILERGESWSKVQVQEPQELTGYCFNGYLDMQEVPKEEYLVWPES